MNITRRILHYKKFPFFMWFKWQLEFSKSKQSKKNRLAKTEQHTILQIVIINAIHKKVGWYIELL